MINQANVLPTQADKLSANLIKPSMFESSKWMGLYAPPTDYG